jgi:hypothetical protein
MMAMILYKLEVVVARRTSSSLTLRGNIKEKKVKDLLSIIMGLSP